jgi:hypothetical protein
VTRALAIGLILLALPAAAAAEEERFSLSLRGGAFNRTDRGYGDHAQVFGLSNPQIGGGGIVEAGVRVLPRLWLLGSWAGFSSSGQRRLDTLSVMNQALLGQIGFTTWRGEFEAGKFAWALRVDLVAGGGLYFISDELDGESQSDSGPGARAGAQVAFSWRMLGFSIAGGYNATRVAIEDRLGGELGAGGIDFGAGLRFQF